MSFIDNLNNINCTADLFRYIGELENKLEEVEKQRDLLLIQMDLKEQRIKELEHKQVNSLIQIDKETRPEAGFKIDYKDYNVNMRKREL